ncbi:hypothetical protein AB835_05600 [Candidatus Endobugula sertula]|uniref:Branched-chain amino acid aminotransferase n=1 Tax=Candidatus Endobugula sertula TaxID=62101 RepID=A0A1D2QR41_9GAMM|nr:hypothetical protein AB835_05600 [Candidatus Endobugula sertula]
MPSPDKSLFYRALKLVSEIEEQWNKPFCSSILYLRPIVFGSRGHIIPMPSNAYEFIVLCAPFIRPYKEEGQNLLVEMHYGRTAPNGVGVAKTAANYSHTHLPNSLINKDQYDAILWLDAATHTYIEETSIANIFVETDDGVFTPNLNGNILAAYSTEDDHRQRLNMIAFSS